MAKSQKQYVFGPVPSRRLGLSLGIDIVPLKSCSLNCVFCQLGRSSDLTIQRKAFVPIADVLAQIKERLAGGVKVNYITISGSGEPTLNSQLGELISGIKKLTDIPVAILTNGTMLFNPAVRAECAKADVVLPSLNAGDSATFQKINRPHKKLHFDALVKGLITFRKEYKGQIWLEVFIVEGINTSDTELAKISEIVSRVQPDKVQLNTAVRPTTELNIKAVSQEKLAKIVKKIGHNAEVIADFPQIKADKNIHIDPKTIIEMLQRRPCSLADMSSSLKIPSEQALILLAGLAKTGQIFTEERNGVIFFKVK